MQVVELLKTKFLVSCFEIPGLDPRGDVNTEFQDSFAFCMNQFLWILFDGNGKKLKDFLNFIENL